MNESHQNRTIGRRYVTAGARLFSCRRVHGCQLCVGPSYNAPAARRPWRLLQLSSGAAPATSCAACGPEIGEMPARVAKCARKGTVQNARVVVVQVLCVYAELYSVKTGKGGGGRCGNEERVRDAGKVSRHQKV